MATRTETLSVRTLLDDGGFTPKLQEISKRLGDNKLDYNLAASAARAYGDATDELKAKQSYLSDNIETQRKRIQTLKEAYDAAKQSQGEDSTVTQKLADDVKKAETAFNNMEAELRKTNGELEQNTKDVKESGDEAEKGEGKWAKFTSGLKSAGKVAGAALAGIAAAGAAAAAGVFKIVSSASTAADNLLTMSQQTHLTVTELQRLTYAQELVDVPLETMTGSMARLVRSMGAVQDGNKKMVSAFKELGVSTTDANGALRSNRDVYFDLLDALGKVGNETDRDRLSMQIFGKSAQDINPLIEAGTAKLRELGDEAERTGYVMGEETVQKLGAFDDTMQRIKNQMVSLRNVAAVAFLPFAQTLADKILPYITQFAQVIGDSSGDVEKLATGISGLLIKGLNELVGALPKVTEVVTSIVTELINGLDETLPQMIPAIIQALVSIGQCVIDNLPTLIDAGIKIAVALIDGLTQAIPQLIPVIIDAVIQIVQTLLANLPVLIQAGMNLLMAVIKGIVAAIPQIIPVIPQLIKQFIDTMVAALPMIVQNATEIINALVEGIIAAIPVLVDAIPQVITALIGGIINALPMIIDSALNIINALIQGIIKALPVLIAAIPQIIIAIIQGLINNLPTLIAEMPKIIVAIITGIAENLWMLIQHAPEIIWALIKGIGECIWELIKAGGQVVGWIWDGLKSAWESVAKWFSDAWNGISDFFSGLWNTVVKWGKGVIDGIWNGLKSAWNSVVKWFEDAWKWISDGWNKFWGIHSPSTRMAVVGQRIAQGLGVGFVGAMKAVREQITDEMQGVRGIVEDGGNIALEGATGAAVQGGMSYNQTVVINNYGKVSAIDTARQVELQSRLLALEF